LFVAGPDVAGTQIKEAIYPVQIGRCFQNNLGLVGSGVTAGVEDDVKK